MSMWLENTTALLTNVDPLTWGGLGACLLSGGIIGLERQYMGKPVGIRTCVLICLGTYVFVAVGLSTINTTSDPTRIIGQIVTGIGFIGAGVMLTRDGSVIGATSAADIWMMAAIGVSIAVVSPLLGIKLAVLSAVTLLVVHFLELRVKRKHPEVHKILNDEPASVRDEN